MEKVQIVHGKGGKRTNRTWKWWKTYESYVMYVQRRKKKKKKFKMLPCSTLPTIQEHISFFSKKTCAFGLDPQKRGNRGKINKITKSLLNANVELPRLNRPMERPCKLAILNRSMNSIAPIEVSQKSM